MSSLLQTIKDHIIANIDPISQVLCDFAEAINATPAVPGMKLNVNAQWITTYDGGVQFANILKQMGTWTQITGSGAFTQRRGTLTPTVGTDEFRAYLSDNGDEFPAGTYTLRNPGGHALAVGSFTNAETFLPWSTATERTFTYNGETSGFLGLWCRNGLSDPNTAIILPNHVTSYDAGNIWNQALLDWLGSLSMSGIRFMDFVSASANIESLWADRILTTDISYKDIEFTGDAVPSAPYEDIVDLANRLNINPWIPLPHRTTSPYWDLLAQLINANLNSNLKVLPEFTNEAWNNANPWGDGTGWIRDYQFTKKTATSNSTTNEFTLVAHGMSEGDPIACYDTTENRAAGINVNYQLRLGTERTVKVIDVDTFQIWEVGEITVVSVVTNQINILFSWQAEPGKVKDLDGEYAKLCVGVWDSFETYLPARVINTVGSQSQNVTRTTDRFDEPGISGRADYVAIAPYFGGQFWMAQIDLNTTVATPKTYCSKAGLTIYSGCYADGSTPLNSEIKAGTGIGYIASDSITSSTPSTSFDSHTQVTVTDGVDYEMFFIMVDGEGFEWRLQVPFTASTVPATVDGVDTYANQAARTRYNIWEKYAILANHYAESDNTDIVCYEGGLHYHQTAPDEMYAWLDLWVAQTGYTNSQDLYYNVLAASNCKEFYNYRDVSDNGYFKLADGYHDVSDPRYVGFQAHGGNVVPPIVISYSDELAEQLTDPVSLPHVFHTFSDANLTYSIYNGDDINAFDIAGDTLRIIDDTNIDWGAPTTITLTIEATTLDAIEYFDVGVSLGDAWYPADATYVFDSINDTDNAEINPLIGTLLPLLNGTGAMITNGLCDMSGGNRYGASSLTPQVDSSKPWLFEHVVDKDNHTATFKQWVRFYGGLSDGMYVQINVGTNLEMQIYDNTTGSQTISLGAYSSFTAGTKYVFWAYYDADPVTPTIHVGYNQTTVNSQVRDLSHLTLGNYRMYIGGDNSNAESDAKQGSLVYVARTGMTLPQAKAIVQEMQDHHSIL